jgi:hypothetical protein
VICEAGVVRSSTTTGCPVSAALFEARVIAACSRLCVPLSRCCPLLGAVEWAGLGFFAVAALAGET